jgi:signal transduction histidine kinase
MGLHGLRTWRLGDVIMAIQSATVSDLEWQSLAEAIGRACREARHVPFVRVVIVMPGDDGLAKRWRRLELAGQSIPVAILGAGEAAEELAEVVAGQGFNTRLHTLPHALDALAWLAVDGARARAMLRALMQAEVAGAQLPPFVAALKDRAATPGTLAVDAERLRLARDLHDGVCSSLAGLRMRLGVLATMHAEESLRVELDALGTKLDGVLDDLRTMAWGMRVGEPNWQQLASYLVKRLQEVGRGRVELTLTTRSAENRVPRDLALDLVREVQSGAEAIIGGTGPTPLSLTVEAEADRVSVRLKSETGQHWARAMPIANP